MEFLVEFVAVLMGARVQRSVGFGLALVVVSALTFVRPEALPATVLLMVMPLGVFMAFKERRAIDVSDLAYVLSGGLLGTLGGVGLLLLVPDRYLSVLFGVLVVLAALTSAVDPDLPLRNPTRLAGGVASGIMGTAAGIGGPPLALVYQSRSGPEVRSTLAVAFFVGTAISLLALALSGSADFSHLVLALELLPALFLGLWAANYVTGFLSGDWLRPTILFFAALSGLTAVFLALVG